MPVLNPKTAKIKVVVGELDWCKYVGAKTSDDVLQKANAPIFQEKFDNVKDVSEVIAWDEEPRDVDLAILKVCQSFVHVSISTVCVQILLSKGSYPTSAGFWRVKIP